MHAVYEHEMLCGYKSPKAAARLTPSEKKS